MRVGGCRRDAGGDPGLQHGPVGDHFGGDRRRLHAVGRPLLGGLHGRRAALLHVLRPRTRHISRTHVLLVN